jgi:transcriptional regulator with XRE-family HTH domain
VASSAGHNGSIEGLVARRLRLAREQRGLSQKELGILAGLDPSVASPRINQYERNRHAPNVAVLAKLASVLDQPLPYFYAVEDDTAALLTAFHRAPKDERARMLALLLPS